MGKCKKCNNLGGINKKTGICKLCERKERAKEKKR